MDLKQYEIQLILHIFDLCTRLSATTFPTTKRRDKIIKELYSIWLAVYSLPQKVLVNNEAEFVDTDFLKMTQPDFDSNDGQDNRNHHILY